MTDEERLAEIRERFSGHEWSEPGFLLRLLDARDREIERLSREEDIAESEIFRLRAERDAARAQVAAMRAVVEMARGFQRIGYRQDKLSPIMSELIDRLFAALAALDGPAPTAEKGR